eukprot:6465579-Amphidinium_carterae.1
MHCHPSEFQNGVGACGSRDLLNHDCAHHASLNAVLLLSSRWLSTTRAGLKNLEDRERIEVFLEVLLAECLDSNTIHLQCCLGHHPPRNGRLPHLTPPLMTIAVTRRGILLASVPSTILQHVPVHNMSPEDPRIRLPVLLRVLYENQHLHSALEQLCVQLGRYFDRHLWQVGWTVTCAAATHRLEAMRENVQYLAAGKRSL